MKRIRIVKEGINFDGLECFREDEWEKWINSRFHGEDEYGFEIADSRSVVNISDPFIYVGDEILRGERFFPNAERAIENIVTCFKIPSQPSGYEESELMQTARYVTRPQLGYEQTTTKVADWLRKGVHRKMTDSYRTYFVRNALGLLAHMQKFEDTQFRDIYLDFLRKRKELYAIGAEHIFPAFLGTQISCPLLELDASSIRRVLQIFKGDQENKTSYYFSALGNLLSRKRKQWREEIKEGGREGERK